MYSHALRTEAAQNELLMEIAQLAQRFARELVARDLADDVAQDVVLECLVKLREHSWTADTSSIPGLIRSMVRRRSIDCLRRTQRREGRDPEHAGDLLDGVRPWMSPEAASDERELTDLYEETLASLPGKCRRIYRMVREERITYELVAARLGLSRSAVSWHIVAAQRRFRCRLKEHGINTPAPYPGTKALSPDESTAQRRPGLG
jgi:RNA polymerase sigma factor (sigma-70 family)